MPRLSLNNTIPVRTIPSPIARHAVSVGTVAPSMPWRAGGTVTNPAAGARISPAGAVPATGAPQASYGAGTFDFETHILVAGLAPVVDRGAFPRRLSETIQEIVGGSASGAGATAIAAPAGIAISAPASGSAAERAAIAAAWNSSPANVPAQWYTISGRFIASSPWQTSALNRAIARAFGNVTSFARSTIGATANRAPAADGAGSSGGPLLDALSRPNACTGARDYASVYAAACTRVGPATAASPATPTMTPTTQGRVDYTKPPTTTPVRPATPPTTTPSTQTGMQVHTTPVQVRPVAQPPAPLAPPVVQQSSSSTPYVVGGIAAVGAGIAIWYYSKKRRGRSS